MKWRKKGIFINVDIIEGNRKENIKYKIRMESSKWNVNFQQVRRALTFSGKHVSFVLPANCDNRMVGLGESPQEEPHENEDAARRHSPPCQLHFSRVLSVMTLALASMSPAGSSASAYIIFMLNTSEPVIRFKAIIAPLNHNHIFYIRGWVKWKP